MLDSNQTFERQSHIFCIKSFMENEIKPSLIPTMMKFFQGRKVPVKWKKNLSKIIELTRGGPQNGNSGILEDISQTKRNLDSLPEDERHTIVNDSCFSDNCNLIVAGLSSLNPKFQVLSDMAPKKRFFPPSGNWH